MSDTPETDARTYVPSLGASTVPAEFARKLERERDDLQKAVNGLCEHLGVSPANTTLFAVEVLKIQRERDEARELLASEKITRNHIIKRSVEVEKERDEARNALADWENAAAHVEADHPDEKHCGCVPVLRKLLTDALKDRDEWAAMCGRYKQERDEALMDRNNGDIATMTINHYERILRERDEAMAEIQRLRLDAQREAEQHDRMVKELEGLYDQLAKTKSSNEHICSFSKDIMGDCIICKKELGNDTFEQDRAKFKLHKDCVTEELQEEINQLLIPLQYRKDGKLIFSYVHKKKEII